MSEPSKPPHCPHCGFRPERVLYCSKCQDRTGCGLPDVGRAALEG